MVTGIPDIAFLLHLEQITLIFSDNTHFIVILKGFPIVDAWLICVLNPKKPHYLFEKYIRLITHKATLNRDYEYHTMIFQSPFG